MATTTPTMDLSPIGRPETIQPSATMVQVFRWPTTVLDTAPVCAMMKNCDMLIKEANKPDLDIVSTRYDEGYCLQETLDSEGDDQPHTSNIMSQRDTGTCPNSGKVSTNGIT